MLWIFMSFLGPQETVLGPFGGPWRPFWWSSWAQMHSGGPWRVPEWIFHDFWWILVSRLGPVWSHFSILSVSWSHKMLIYIATIFLDGFWMENNQFSNVPTSQKHSKYNCFHEISLFPQFLEFDGFRHHFGDHFGGFGDLQDSFWRFLVVLEAP